MLLAVDIGNSNIKFGIYDGESLISDFSIPTNGAASSKDISRALAEHLNQDITTAIICSVVPELNAVLSDALSMLYAVTPVLVGNDFDFGLGINYQPLTAVGTDRLVNAFSAVEKYGVPVIVCSFGTALTVDFVSRDRVLKGGVIAPGMKLLTAALKMTTSQLPEVEIVKPTRVLQNTTVGSIQSGIFHGYIGLVEGLLTRVTDEIGESARVIATGGFANLVAEQISQIDAVDRTLTLDGLRRLAQRIGVT